MSTNVFKSLFEDNMKLHLMRSNKVDVYHDAEADPAGEKSEEPRAGDRAQGEQASLPGEQYL